MPPNNDSIFNSLHCCHLFWRNNGTRAGSLDSLTTRIASTLWFLFRECSNKTVLRARRRRFLDVHACRTCIYRALGKCTRTLRAGAAWNSFNDNCNYGLPIISISARNGSIISRLDPVTIPSIPRNKLNRRFPVTKSSVKSTIYGWYRKIGDPPTNIPPIAL